MQIYLTKTRWLVLSLMQNGLHPRPVSVEQLQQCLDLSARDAGLTLSGLELHGVLARVGSEYRVTRKGAELLVAMRTGTINDVTLEVDDD